MWAKGLIWEYDALEKQFKIIDSSSIFSNLVTANGNTLAPIHRWFRMKESFSIDLLDNLINYWCIPPKSIHSILDPFCGSGTTLLSTQKIAKKYDLNGLRTYGIEANPFLHFVSKTKVNWNLYSANDIETSANNVLCSNLRNDYVPMLTTLHKKEVYQPALLKKALSYKCAIDSLPKNVREPILLGYANTLVPISGVRKDGRGLRIVPNKQRPKLKNALTLSWNNTINDLKIAKQYYKKIRTGVILGDGRTLASGLNVSKKIKDIDLIVYSPPYLNNIDYTEVYKIELWMCGFINSNFEFKNQRYKTLRSHPSVKFYNPITIYEDERLLEVSKILNNMIYTLPKNEDLVWRKRLFQGYFDDMYISLKHQKEALAHKGWIFCVIGNSLHGSMKKDTYRVPVASDLLIALIAKSIGLEVKAIQIARYLNRRCEDNYYLRESIIVMQKID